MIHPTLGSKRAVPAACRHFCTTAPLDSRPAKQLHCHAALHLPALHLLTAPAWRRASSPRRRTAQAPGMEKKSPRSKDLGLNPPKEEGGGDNLGMFGYESMLFEPGIHQELVSLYRMNAFEHPSNQFYTCFCCNAIFFQLPETLVFGIALQRFCIRYEFIVQGLTLAVKHCTAKFSLPRRALVGNTPQTSRKPRFKYGRPSSS